MFVIALLVILGRMIVFVAGCMAVMMSVAVAVVVAVSFRLVVVVMVMVKAAMSRSFLCMPDSGVLNAGMMRMGMVVMVAERRCELDCQDGNSNPRKPSLSPHVAQTGLPKAITTEEP